MRKKVIFKSIIVIILSFMFGLFVAHFTSYFYPSNVHGPAGLIVKYYQTPSKVIKYACKYSEECILYEKMKKWGEKEAKEIFNSGILDDPDPIVRNEASGILCYLKYEPAIPFLLEMLKDDKIDIGYHLAHFEDKIFYIMVNNLTNKNPAIRKNSYNFITSSKTCDNEKVLKKILYCLKNDMDKNVRFAAAIALKNTKKTVAINILRQYSKDDKSERVRQGCEIALNEIKRNFRHLPVQKLDSKK